MYACTPQSVVTWEGFKDDVTGAIWDDTPKYFRLVFQESDEAGEAFDRSIHSWDIVPEPDFTQSLN